MATTITATAAIPLMSHGPSATAVNSASNYRQGFIGPLLAPAPSGPMAWLSGVFCTTSTLATYSVDLLPIPLTTPGQGVVVYPGVAVVSRGPSNGPYLVLFNNTSTISLDAASTTNPRIDVVYVQLNDDAIGDGGPTNGGFMAVVNGTPSSSPAVPAIPTNAIPLAQIYRNTVAGGGNVISSSNITDVRTSTGTAGGIRPYLPGDSTTASGGHNGEFTFNTVTGTLRYWLNGSWHGVAPKVIPTTAFPIAANTNMNASNTIYNLAYTTVPDPGYPYYMVMNAKSDFYGFGTGAAEAVTLRLDNSTTGTIMGSGGTSCAPNWGTGGLNGVVSAQMTGAHTVYFNYETYGSPPTANFPGGASGAVWCNVTIIPV